MQVLRAESPLTVAQLRNWLGLFPPNTLVEAYDAERSGLSIWSEGRQIGFIEMPPHPPGRVRRD